MEIQQRYGGFKDGRQEPCPEIRRKVNRQTKVSLHNNYLSPSIKQKRKQFVYTIASSLKE